MKSTLRLSASLAALVIAASLVGLPAQLSAQQGTPAAAVTVGTADIGGVVTSANGPEAGVWVIAQTIDLPTKFVKIVVTDDQGRYVLPELPKANYDIWVRGYGLVDSPKVKGRTRQGARSQSRGGGERCGGGRILPGAILVFDAQDSRQEPVPRQRRWPRAATACRKR